MSRIRVLGLDPGTATVGWGVVDSDGQNLSLAGYGTIRTPAGRPLVERLGMIFEELNVLLDRFEPTGVSVEQLFFAKNVSTALPVAHARGVMLLAAHLRGLPLSEFRPMQIKQTITGYGGADKGQMQHMVRLLLSLDDIPRPDDAADAVAVAICFHHTTRYDLLAEE